MGNLLLGLWAGIDGSSHILWKSDLFGDGKNNSAYYTSCQPTPHVAHSDMMNISSNSTSVTAPASSITACWLHGTRQHLAQISCYGNDIACWCCRLTPSASGPIHSIEPSSVAVIYRCTCSRVHRMKMIIIVECPILCGLHSM